MKKHNPKEKKKKGIKQDEDDGDGENERKGKTQEKQLEKKSEEEEELERGAAAGEQECNKKNNNENKKELEGMVGQILNVHVCRTQLLSHAIYLCCLLPMPHALLVLLLLSFFLPFFLPFFFSQRLLLNSCFSFPRGFIVATMLPVYLFCSSASLPSLLPSFLLPSASFFVLFSTGHYERRVPADRHCG